MARLPDALFAFDIKDPRAERWPKPVYKSVRELASYLHTSEVGDLEFIVDDDGVAPVLQQLRERLDGKTLAKFRTVHGTLQKWNEDPSQRQNPKDVGDICAHAVRAIYEAATNPDSDIHPHFKVDGTLDHPECLWKIWLLIVWSYARSDNPDYRMQKNIRAEKTRLWVYPESDKDAHATELEPDHYAQIQLTGFAVLETRRPNLVVAWASPEDVSTRPEFCDTVTYGAEDLDNMSYADFQDALRWDFALVTLRHDIFKVTAKHGDSAVAKRVRSDRDFGEIKDQLRKYAPPEVLMITQPLEFDESVKFNNVLDISSHPSEASK